MTYQVTTLQLIQHVKKQGKWPFGSSVNLTSNKPDGKKKIFLTLIFPLMYKNKCNNYLFIYLKEKILVLIQKKAILAKKKF